MSIYRVIDKLEAYVREGTVLPMRYRILSEERLLEYIEKMRSTLPEEVGRAKLIAKDKDRVMREAQEKAQAIVTEATSAHNELVDNSEILRQARATAEVVLREAEERAAKVRAGADAYASQVLADLELRLSTALGSVVKGREALAGVAPAARPERGKGRARAAGPATAEATAAQPVAQAPAELAEAAAKNKRAAFDAQAEETAALESVEAAR